MHDIEPFYNWRHLYVSEEDERSPFYGRIYSEFEFTQTIYNYYIHPQWDEFGSRTLYMKVLLADYDRRTLCDNRALRGMERCNRERHYVPEAGGDG